jgi:hypothetical protein
MLKRFITAIEARLRKLPELFQIVRAEDVRSLLLGHSTLSYFDLQEILQIEQHAAASVDSPVIHGNCKVCGDLRTLSCWDSDVGGRACEECSGFLVEAENVLLEHELVYPPEALVVRNP